MNHFHMFVIKLDLLITGESDSFRYVKSFEVRFVQKREYEIKITL